MGKIIYKQMEEDEQFDFAVCFAADALQAHMDKSDVNLNVDMNDIFVVIKALSERGYEIRGKE